MEYRNSVMKRAKLRKYGKAGVQVAIPKEFAEDVGLEPTNRVQMSRVGNSGLLIEPVKEASNDQPAN